MSRKNSFRYLEKQVLKISKFYFKNRLLSAETPKDEKKIATVRRIVFSYEKLEYEDKKIINHEFFFQGYPMWWTKVYSEEEFYLKKYFAMSHFLEVFDNDY